MPSWPLSLSAISLSVKTNVERRPWPYCAMPRMTRCEKELTNFQKRSAHTETGWRKSNGFGTRRSAGPIGTTMS